MRLGYSAADTPEKTAVADSIISERGRLLDLYRILLHSPMIAGSWLRLLTAIRMQTSLSPMLRELVIIRIAILNGASYEAEHHKPIALEFGVSELKIADLDNWQSSSAYTELERAVLAYTDAMTKHIRVPDDVFAAVYKLLTEKLMVELTATIAAYNMVSRFLEALEIHPNPLELSKRDGE